MDLTFVFRWTTPLTIMSPVVLTKQFKTTCSQGTNTKAQYASFQVETENVVKVTTKIVIQ